MLTTDAIKMAAREYHAKGMLTAQDPDPSQRSCVLLNPETGRRCAIGAALTEEQIGRCHRRNASLTIEVSDVVPMEDLATADLIQRTHDGWLSGSHSEASFLKLIAA